MIGVIVPRKLHIKITLSIEECQRGGYVKGTQSAKGPSKY